MAPSPSSWIGLIDNLIYPLIVFGASGIVATASSHLSGRRHDRHGQFKLERPARRDVSGCQSPRWDRDRPEAADHAPALAKAVLAPDRDALGGADHAWALACCRVTVAKAAATVGDSLVREDEQG